MNRNLLKYLLTGMLLVSVAHSSESDDPFEICYQASQCKLKGLEKEKNRKEAIKLYEKVADKIPAAANSLGAIYEIYENNLEKAEFYYKMSAESDYSLALENLKRMKEEYKIGEQERKKTPPSKNIDILY